ncbi:MAG: GDP-L-fucose synthase family protein [Hyphomonadaceae bacterium]
MASKVYDLRGKRIWLAGHRGMVGSAIERRLLHRGDVELLTADRQRVDLLNQAAVGGWLREMKPDAIIVAAAKVGGILANDSQPADFLYENLVIASNIIGAAHAEDVDRLLFLGSSCIYPKLASQPLSEDALLTGPLEPTNEWYAIAKIAGIKLCDSYRKQYRRSYISAMPTNLYGQNDNFDLRSSHVLPALMRRIHDAKVQSRPSVERWGTGAPLREFMHVDDLGDACVFLMEHYDEAGPINAGSGDEISIRGLAELIAQVVGYKGNFSFDPTKPDGTPRKVMDSSRLRAMGWERRIELEVGIRSTYHWYLENAGRLRGAA